MKQTEMKTDDNAVISSNATCGDPQPEIYCKLVEHVPGRTIKNPHCAKCDANSVLSKERHPIAKAIDGTNQWWQSPSIKNGRQFHWVTITLDLKQVFQVAYIIIKAANSPRPGNWILERSLDGVSFDPWQFYAISDSECLTRYNMTPRLGPPTYQSDTEVICTSYYSRLNPLEHGEIHTSLINGRPGADDLTSDLLNFTSARYIRLRLQRIRTLNADLMTLSDRDPRDIDPIVTRRYYYSIKDVSVGGMCICYGHAQSCPLDPVTQKLQCLCEHNTCGESCNECCRGYHQQPWQPGTISEGNTCEECNCHNKSLECFFNQTVSDLSLSLNSDGVRRGGGVCIDCQKNTAGINCETCRDGYYRPAEVSPFSDSPCSECRCDLRGSKSLVCSRDDTQPGVSAGQCVCQEGFAGRRCDRCAFGFRDFPQCVRCDCNLSGSTNTDPCSPCTCKVNVMGDNCDLCKPGFYNLQENNPLGCTDCFCFGVSDVCESSAWSTVQGTGQSLRLSPPLLLFLSPLAERPVAVAMVPQRFMDHQTGVPVTRDDLLSVLAGVTALMVRVHLNSSADGPIRLHTVSLDAADSGSVSGVPAVAVENCECPWGYNGTSCEVCSPGFYRVDGVMFGGNCMLCECNDHATECDANGECVGCTHNTTGPHCDKCVPGFYGDATEGTAHDCRLCPCPLTDLSNRFSPTCVLDASGQVSCDQCQDGYTGNTCERCASGFYGNPQVVGGTCIRCQCNGNVNVSEPGHCDTVTGECLHCLGNTAGSHCEVCRPGCYGDAVGRGCHPCGCSQLGSLSESCDEEGRCQCVEGVAGDRCDRCSRGYYGFHGSGCKACTCDHTGGNCDPESGECICPAHTEGHTCDRCETGHWGHEPTTAQNCLHSTHMTVLPMTQPSSPCSCSAAGSSAPQCDLTNGQCLCREGFSGRSCDRCAPGYYGYPACSACGCDLAGTNQMLCNATLGVCDCQHTGECVCKVAGVSGRHCEECVSGRLGLSAENPDGCSQCFCSGLSSDCEEQGGLTRVPVSTSTACCTRMYTQYTAGGDMLLDTRQLNSSGLSGPLYWRLPAQFEGDQLLSYGGLLSYSITFYAEDGSGLSNQEPQVLMRGGALRKLVIYTDVVAPGNGVRTQHDIRLTEHQWKYFNSVSLTAVSHSDFLSVLSNVQYVIIKASYGTRLQQMDRRKAATGQSEHRNCCYQVDNPSVSLSQECAAGYFRQHQSELSPHSQRSIFVHPCVPCRCNNHSESCNTETGDCQDCQHHTSGRSCELCAPGYHGNVSGSIGDCSLCACPLHDNSFSPTCVSEGAFGDFRCTSCETGYEGRYCERCSVGYYGNPSVSGGVCQHCSCSRQGSLHPRCDALTGQCECRPGNTGRSCDQCDNKHVLQGAECVSCDDDCTGVLLDDLTKLNHLHVSVNLSGVAMVTYWQLVSLHNQSRDLQVETCPNVTLSMLRSVSSPCNTSPDQQVEVLDSQLDQWRPLLRRQVDGLVVGLKQMDALESVYRAENHAHLLQSHRKIEEAEHRTRRLMDRIKPLSILGETLDRNLSDIRELIDQARRQAASIKVAVQADRECVRSYRPQIESSNFNTLSLILKTSRPDNLLFYLGSNATVDFLAVEMHAGKVSLLWDVGAGVSRLDFSGLDITNNRWTRINATRFGARAALSVHQLDSESPPLPTVTATSPGSSRVLDIDRNTVIHVGGLGSPAALRSSSFQGCLGENIWDTHTPGTHIPGTHTNIWNTHTHLEHTHTWNTHLEHTQTPGTHTHTWNTHTHTWNTHKHLEHTHTPGTHTHLEHTYLEHTRTHLEHTHTPGTHTHLEHTYLEHTQTPGTHTHLEHTHTPGTHTHTWNTHTPGTKYNTGVWFKITLQRNRRKAYLSIMAADQPSEKEVLEAESPGMASDLNRSDLDPIYIGGLPASRPIRRQVVSRSYVGCIRNVEIARSNFDLLRDAFGVRKGCVLKVLHVLTYTHSTIHTVLYTVPYIPYYIQYYTYRIIHSTIHTVLYIQYYIYSIIHTVLYTTDRYLVQQTDRFSMLSSDMSEHRLSQVSVEVSRRLVSVSVDGLSPESVPVKGNQLDVDNRLYLGGFPNTATSRRINVSSSFPGCVRSASLNGASLDLSQPTSQSDVAACFTKDQPGSYFNGSGYAKLIHDGYKVGSDMSVSLEFRTSQSEGVFVGISSAKVDAVGLEMIDGQVVFNVNNGAGRVSVRSIGQMLCDGRWHRLLARKTKHSLSLSVDGRSYTAPNPYPQSTSAETNNPVYLGGFPVGVKQNCLSISSSFRGCLRNLQLAKSHLSAALYVSSAHFLVGVTPNSCPVA
uniref:Laminin, alpha 1 n=1 Tax=Amphiprion ocellaris TaxID=80972 RepID=A0A3Q1CA21_AMPOC